MGLFKNYSSSNMGADQKKDSKFQTFLDTHQYARKGILLYERIFGTTYVSTGGESTTAKFCSELSAHSLKPNDKILDVGCGIGGSAFYMAKNFGVQVYGYDLSVNMINIANDLRHCEPANVKHAVQFYVEDATLMDYPDQFYDMVYSRDTILHIKDKKALFEMFYRTLKPGGKLVITDYCHGDKPKHSQHFVDYVASRGYHLHTVQEYGKIIESAGFVDVKATNMTPGFIDILKGEVTEFSKKKQAIIEEFSQKDFDYIVTGWNDKIKRCSDGDQAWGYFVAKKPYA